MPLTLLVLDLAPIAPDETSAQALANTVRRTKAADLCAFLESFASEAHADELITVHGALDADDCERSLRLTGFATFLRDLALAQGVRAIRTHPLTIRTYPCSFARIGGYQPRPMQITTERNLS